MTAAPDQCHIDHALRVAERSPCRSKRGVVLFNARTGAHCGEGFNGPPASLGCPGRERCAGNCGQRSVHAEVRALRDAARWAHHHDMDEIELLHVELAPPAMWRSEVDRSADGLPIGLRITGQVIACDGPSCWQCAREILDVGFVGGVWLYEAARVDAVDAWDRWYQDRAAAIAAATRKDHGKLQATSGTARWRRYTAEEFYRATLLNCGVVP